MEERRKSPRYEVDEPAYISVSGIEHSLPSDKPLSGSGRHRRSEPLVRSAAISANDRER